MTLSAQDKIEIQELSARYANAMDDQDMASWMATWADDGVWEGGIGTYEGTTNLKRVLSDLGDRVKGKRHIMTNIVIDGSGDQAQQTCYLMVVEAAGPPAVLGTAVYKDSLRKINGQWAFARRTVKLDKR